MYWWSTSIASRATSRWSSSRCSTKASRVQAVRARADDSQARTTPCPGQTDAASPHRPISADAKRSVSFEHGFTTFCSAGAERQVARVDRRQWRASRLVTRNRRRHGRQRGNPTEERTRWLRAARRRLGGACAQISPAYLRPNVRPNETTYALSPRSGRPTRTGEVRHSAREVTMRIGATRVQGGTPCTERWGRQSGSGAVRAKMTAPGTASSGPITSSASMVNPASRSQFVTLLGRRW